MGGSGADGVQEEVMELPEPSLEGLMAILKELEDQPDWVAYGNRRLDKFWKVFGQYHDGEHEQGFFTERDTLGKLLSLWDETYDELERQCRGLLVASIPDEMKTDLLAKIVIAYCKGHGSLSLNGVTTFLLDHWGYTRVQAELGKQPGWKLCHCGKVPEDHYHNPQFLAEVEVLNARLNGLFPKPPSPALDLVGVGLVELPADLFGRLSSLISARGGPTPPIFGGPPQSETRH